MQVVHHALCISVEYKFYYINTVRLNKVKMLLNNEIKFLILIFFLIGILSWFLPNNLRALDSCENDVCVPVTLPDGSRISACIDFSSVPTGQEGFNCNAGVGSECNQTAC